MAGEKQNSAAKNIAESFSASPMQQGMLFHSLSGPHSGVDIEQILCTLPEELNVPAFRQAWERVVARHRILRTGFRVGSLEPQQDVHREVRLQFEQKDWRGLTKREQEGRLDAFLRADRRRGFELSVPPLMRLALFRAGEAKHVLAWTFHHLLLDGHSLVRLFGEVFHFYEAICQGRELHLPAPRPYRDYIEWLRKRDWSGAEAFWRKRLKGFTTPTPFGAAFAPDKAQDAKVGHSVQQATLSRRETGSLRSVAKDNGLTLNTLLQGTWALLLARYSGTEDVVFGVVRACRRSTVEGAESIIGLFVNTLPMRVQVTGDTPVRDWLNGLRAQHLALREHEHTPLVHVQRWSGVPPGQPLFESILNFQDPSWDAALRDLGGQWANREFAIRNQPNVPLWADVSGGPEMTIRIGYDPDRIQDATVTRMLGHFQSVLKAMAADLSQRVADLPLLADAEQRQWLAECNDTETGFPRNQCVHELFETQVERTPNAVALVYSKEEVSYRELDNQANRVARHLRSLFIGPDVPVGICVQRSADMVVALLGILKAGGAYVPLDPAYPKERLEFMLEDSRAPVLLTHGDLASRFQFQIPHCRVVCLESLGHAAGKGRGEGAPRTNVSADNLAYIIYTSGSTGTPKGVELSHRGLVNLLTWHQRAYRVTPRDRATQLAGFSFDASVWEIWPYLTAGASIHIVDDETRASASSLVQWLTARKITISFVPTPVAEETLAVPWPKDTALRVMLTGGDKLQRRPERNLPFGLFNHYGPTENTVVSTCALIEPAQGGTNVTPPIGRPIDNVQAYVLDHLLRPVPVGVPGELYIGGENLARGYRNNPVLTTEKFIPHPLSDRPGARLYKTGDLVRWLADGNLEFLRRIDHQVKIRGYRIEPGEIETLLNQFPAVRESLVLARDNGCGQRKLTAYMILHRRPAPPVKELRDYLRPKLPDSMVPSAFVFLDAWPLTPNGKVDLNALPTPDRSGVKSSEKLAAPRNSIEATVAKTWSTMLGRARLGIHDNFFVCGGHSLLAAKAVSLLKESFNIHLSIRSLFEKPTVAEFAKEIERRTARPAPRRGPGLTRVSREQYRVNPLSLLADGEMSKHR